MSNFRWKFPLPLSLSLPLPLHFFAASPLFLLPFTVYLFHVCPSFLCSFPTVSLPFPPLFRYRSSIIFAVSYLFHLAGFPLMPCLSLILFYFYRPAYRNEVSLHTCTCDVLLPNNTNIETLSSIL